MAVWEYAEHSARYIFGDALGDPLADEILAAIPASEKLRQTWAALAQSKHNALCDVATLRKTPQMAAGYVRHGV